jgi:hypothetical protein
VVWPEVGHSPQVERPDEFVRLLLTSARRSPVMRLRTWLWRLRQLNRGPLPGPGEDEPSPSPVELPPRLEGK